MKTTIQKRIGQALIISCLSCSVFVAGSLMPASPSAHAATANYFGGGMNNFYNDFYHFYDYTGRDRYANDDDDSSDGSNSSGTKDDSKSNQTNDSSSDSSANPAWVNALIAKGKTYMGTPYKFGAKTGATASFDCSSFTQYLYELQGITLPRESIQQSKAGTYVKRSDLQPGDLVFFYSPVHHVGIYIGNGKILHTYGDPGVTIDDLDSGWWDEHYTTARRVTK
ncbi:MAG: NlpC/P60 family protein [Paenibacillus sp.]|nr:NlpC/P60 family protein [Paenibacillus sp.]